MTALSKLAYDCGAQEAHIKLGTCAGPIEYSRSAERSMVNSVKENQLQRTDKEISEHDNAFELTKSADYIRGDLDKIKPHKALIQKSTIDQAFSTNNAIGEELGLGDPPTTQPHGGDKIAALNPFGATPRLGPTMARGMAPGASLKSALPKNPLTDIRAQTNGMLNNSAVTSRGFRAGGEIAPVPTVPPAPSVPPAVARV